MQSYIETKKEVLGKNNFNYKLTLKKTKPTPWFLHFYCPSESEGKTCQRFLYLSSWYFDQSKHNT